MTPSGTIDGLEQSAQLTADRVLNTPPRFKSATRYPGDSVVLFMARTVVLEGVVWYDHDQRVRGVSKPLLSQACLEGTRGEVHPEYGYIPTAIIYSWTDQDEMSARAIAKRAEEIIAARTEAENPAPAEPTPPDPTPAPAKPKPKAKSKSKSKGKSKAKTDSKPEETT